MNTRHTQEHREPSAIEVPFAIHKVREILRLVKHQAILCLPAREILKRLKSSDVGCFSTLVKGAVYTRVMIFGEIDGKIKIDQWKPFLESFDGARPISLGLSLLVR